MRWGWVISCDDRQIGVAFTDTPDPEVALDEFAATTGTYPWDWQQCINGWPVANLIGEQDV
jgi:hypothetical protein